MIGAMNYNNMPIIENAVLTCRVLTVMCRSKKKRQVRKWSKNDKHYHDEPDTKNVYIMNSPYGKTLVCHPLMTDRIKKAIREQNMVRGIS